MRHTSPRSRNGAPARSNRGAPERPNRGARERPNRGAPDRPNRGATAGSGRGAPTRSGRGAPTRSGRGAPERSNRAPARPLRPARGGDIDRLLSRQDWDSLIPHLLKAGVDPDGTIVRLRRYAAMLIEWNRRVSNIISRNDEERIVERHIAESIEPAAWLKESGAAKWLDFGSGAGLPAIPLMIAGVGERWTLVDSRRVKTLFLAKAVETLELTGVEVIQARLEVLVGAPERHSAYQGFTSRATQTLAPTLVLAQDLVPPGGKAFLWKGSQREQEMASNPGWQRDWEFDGLLGIGAGQTAVARFTRKA